MSLVEALSRLAVPRQGANELRWRGQRGHFEAWYVTFNLREERLGVWLRYTLNVPLGEPAFCELWGHVFDHRHPARSFGVRDRLSAHAMRHPEGAAVAIDSAVLADRFARGRLEQGGHRLVWDLELVPHGMAVHLAPWPLKRLHVVRTQVLFASGDARISGRLIVDGTTYDIASEPGSQSHLWGSKHPARWAWGHCNAFRGRDDCSVDAVSAWDRRFRTAAGPRTAIYVRYQGKDYFLNTLAGLMRARGHVRFPAWDFNGTAGGLTFRGSFRGSPERMLQVAYEDPDGELAWCSNSEVADLVLRIYRGRRLLDELEARGTAHLEYGDRQRRNEVRASV